VCLTRQTNRSEMTLEAKRAAKLEKKLKILLGGYQVLSGYCCIVVSWFRCLLHKHKRALFSGYIPDKLDLASSPVMITKLNFEGRLLVAGCLSHHPPMIYLILFNINLVQEYTKKRKKITIKN